MEKNELKEKVTLVIKDYDAFYKKYISSLNKISDYINIAIKHKIDKYPNINLEFFTHILDYIKRIIKNNKDKYSNINLEFFTYLSDYVSKLLKMLKFSYPFIVYCIEKIIYSIILQIDYIPKNVKKVKMPPELQVDYLVTDEIDNANEHIKEQINNFIKMLFTNFSEELLIYFFRNIGSLETQIISEESDPTRSTVVLGSYSVSKNRIEINEEIYENTVFHELFHLASSYYDSKAKTSYCGFSQNNRSITYNIGKGINEGYTQLLTNRYTAEDPYSYPKETRIAEIIESVIGKENMQKYYFAANLKGLIDELTKYKSKEEIMKFLQMMDFNLEYRYQKSLIPSKDKKLKSSEQYIEKFLLDICLIKLKFEMVNSDLSFLEIKLQELYTKIHHNIIPNFNFAEYVSQILGCNIIIDKNEDGTIKVNIENLPDFKEIEESKKGMSL